MSLPTKQLYWPRPVQRKKDHNGIGSFSINQLISLAKDRHANTVYLEVVQEEVTI